MNDTSYLTTVKDEVQVFVIRSLLLPFDIPVVEIHRDVPGRGSILTGDHSGSIDLFVPSPLQERAIEIISLSPGVKPEISDYENDETRYKIERIKYKYRRFLIVLLFLPSIIGFFIYFIYKFLMG